MARAVLGGLMVAAGVALGLYVGVWWAFVGGIVDVVQAIRAPELVSTNLAIGIAKVMFAGMVGQLSTFALAAPGVVLIRSARD